MISILISTLFGIIFGILAGLIPGIHPNLICTILLSLSVFLLDITTPLVLSVFIVSTALTNTFFNSIPSIYLGAPESDTALNILPGHRLLLKGKGHEAVLLTLIGSLSSMILCIALIPIAILLVRYIYPLIKAAIPHILIISIAFIILKDKSRFWSFLTFMIAGTYGLTVFSMKMENPLFPMLSGLFGTSTLITSLYQKTSLPRQIISYPVIEKLKAYKSIVVSVLSGGLVSFLPGLGSAEAAVMGSTLTGKIEAKNFLILTGGINTVNFILSFVSLLVLDKARNGAIAAISQILEEFTISNLLVFVGITLISGGIATISAVYMSKVFSKLITKVNYNALCFSIICLIFVLVIALTGLAGLSVLVVGTFVGLIPITKNIARSHLMGCLILPVILYFLL